MELRTRTPVLLLLVTTVTPAEALTLYDPQLCYILDGFLSVYGLIITAMFIKERFFRTKAKESIYSDLKTSYSGGYEELRRRDVEGGGRSRGAVDEETYTDLNKQAGTEYKQLPVRRERPRKADQVYQDLSSASRDTYQSLQMQQLPAR